MKTHVMRFVIQNGIPIVQPGSIECEEKIKELEKELKKTSKKNHKLEHELYVLKEAFKVMGATG